MINFKHPYDMRTARWIRSGWLMESDDNKRAKFLQEIVDMFGKRSAEILQYIRNDYRVFIRDDQMWPDFNDITWDEAVWSCGRGYGKTYAGAPATTEYAIDFPGCHIGILAPTFAMARDNMVKGSSGLISLAPIGFEPKFNKSEGFIEWPNGSTAKIFSSENGGRVRGQNFHATWTDEFTTLKFTGDDTDLWENAKLALRIGKSPKSIVTTSPRPIRQLIDLYNSSKKKGKTGNVLFKTGTTFDNYTYSQSYIDKIKKGEGTSLYNQEVLGMILEENTGAIFVNENILRVDIDGEGQNPDKYNDRLQKLISSIDSIVIGVDPNVVEDIKSDETGITVCGRKGDKGFVFKDASRRGKLSNIYEEIVRLYHQYRADAIVVETNNGGDFIPLAIYNIDQSVVVKKVFASRGKRSRAEPIGMLYERHKIYHVGIHRDLESQMCAYNPQVDKKSPDYPKTVWSTCKQVHCKNSLITGTPLELIITTYTQRCSILELQYND